MRSDYFERLHQAETRHAEWALLDQALASLPTPQAQQQRTVRQTLGAWLIHWGIRLQGYKQDCYCLAQTTSEDARG